MAGSGSSAISQARIEVLDETGARETKSRGVLNERALGIGRLIFGWHLPFHVAQIRDARALDGKLIIWAWTMLTWTLPTVFSLCPIFFSDLNELSWVLA
jgi:hypothetical protein